MAPFYIKSSVIHPVSTCKARLFSELSLESLSLSPAGQLEWAATLVSRTKHFPDLG